MKKLFTVIMVFSLFTSLFASFGSKAQDATAPTATPATTEATPAVAPTETTPATSATATPAGENPLENILLLDLEDGKVVIQLTPDVAPNHVKRIKELTRQGFYNGVVFHRVIEGFMAQTGDPTGTGTGGSGQKVDAEFNSTKHVRGTVSMARAADPNSADSQFFIVLADAPHLDGNYTAFGKVIEGMEFVDKIKKGTGPNGMVSEPSKIIKLQVSADDKAGTAVPAEDKTAPAVAVEPAKSETPATPAETKTEPAKH
jgi:peptidylprolyl isomerase